MPPKTRRMTAAEYQALFKSVEPRVDREVHANHEDAPPAPAQVPVSPSVEEEDPMEEEEEEVEAVEEEHENNDISSEEMMEATQDQVDEHSSPPSQGGSDGGDGPQGPMGWTVTISRVPGCHTSSHLRLMRLLRDYYADWDPAVQYTCFKHTHPLEGTHWRTHVAIGTPGEMPHSFVIEMIHEHKGVGLTQEDSIEDAAFEAWVALRGHRFANMQYDEFRFLPRTDASMKDGWAMMNPQDLPPEARELTNFACDMMVTRDRLVNTVERQEKTIKKLQEEIDRLRISNGQPRIYEHLGHEARP